MKYNQPSVIVFNGPPGSGKDEICKYLAMRHKDHHMEFKKKLIELVLCFYNLTENQFYAIYNDRILKEKPMSEFKGRSARQALIHMSEVVIKPNFGKDYFGVAAAENLRMQPGDLNVFSDGGFLEEIIPVCERVKDNLAIVQVYREGCSFDNDSRNYINEVPGHDIPIMKLYNDGTLRDLYSKVDTIIEKLFGNKD